MVENILVLGSIAYDNIMEFTGDLNDNLTSKKEDKVFNIAVMPHSKQVNFGGTSGNISYNLALIEGKISVITAVGKDFVDLGYQKHLQKFPNLSFKGDIHSDSFTASAYIVNDVNHNQMIIFHQGAMVNCPSIKLRDKDISKEKIKLATVSPDNYDAMVAWARELDDLEIEYILDPGQVTPAFSAEILKELIPKAKVLIGNEFEINMIQEKLGTDTEGLLKLNPNLIITMGEKGSVCYDKGKKSEVKICTAKQILDTTGAGDGYRAGFLLGLSKNLTLVDACKIGAATSSFVVESAGPQTQKYNLEDVKARYKENFDADLILN